TTSCEWSDCSFMRSLDIRPETEFASRAVCIEVSTGNDSDRVSFATSPRLDPVATAPGTDLVNVDIRILFRYIALLQSFTVFTNFKIVPQESVNAFCQTATAPRTII